MPGFLSGCASISKGITEAILERDNEDTRQCWITGRSFAGLDSLFQDETSEAANPLDPGKLKVLMVHGIGDHVPGYSRRLQDGLVAEFGFDNMDETVKSIDLASREYAGNLGVLRVHRYMNLNRSREMLFYELTWDPVVAGEKHLISYDNAKESSINRAPLNHTLKTFINSTVPDVLMYNTKYRTPIQLSVAQAICWVMSDKWDALPNNQKTYCDANRSDYLSQFDDSGIAIISHSMGSRISLDALQEAMAYVTKRPGYEQIIDKMKNKPIYLYMLSNQLPLLQLGQPLPEVHDQVRAICSAYGDRHDERFFEKLQVVAFSDPNDLFSYKVSPEYVNRYVDSRLCPGVTNVLVQVAPIRSILGAQELANPLVAHSDYEVDSRVLKMLVSGFGMSHGDDEVRERCEFIESIPDY